MTFWKVLCVLFGWSVSGGVGAGGWGQPGREGICWGTRVLVPPPIPPWAPQSQQVYFATRGNGMGRCGGEGGSFFRGAGGEEGGLAPVVLRGGGAPVWGGAPPWPRPWGLSRQQTLPQEGQGGLDEGKVGPGSCPLQAETGATGGPRQGPKGPNQWGPRGPKWGEEGGASAEAQTPPAYDVFKVPESPQSGATEGERGMPSSSSKFGPQEGARAWGSGVTVGDFNEMELKIESPTTTGDLAGGGEVASAATVPPPARVTTPRAGKWGASWRWSTAEPVAAETLPALPQLVVDKAEEDTTKKSHDTSFQQRELQDPVTKGRPTFEDRLNQRTKPPGQELANSGPIVGSPSRAGGGRKTFVAGEDKKKLMRLITDLLQLAVKSSCKAGEEKQAMTFHQKCGRKKEESGGGLVVCPFCRRLFSLLPSPNGAPMVKAFSSLTNLYKRAKPSPRTRAVTEANPNEEATQ